MIHRLDKTPLWNLAILIPIASISASYFYGDWYYRAITLLIGLTCLLGMRRHWQIASANGLSALLAVLAIFSGVAIFQTQGLSVLILLIFLCQFAISLSVINSTNASRILNATYFAFLALSISLVIFFSYGPSEFDTFLDGVGRNGYSAILFALMVGYCTRQVLAQKPVSIILVGLTFFMMFPLFGRSSISASGLVFLAVIARRLGRASFIYLPPVLILGVWFLPDLLGVDLLEVIDSTNFRSGGESERWFIIEEWLANLGPINLMFGVDLSTLDTVRQLENNPHNAFIRLQSFFGAGVALLGGAMLASLCYLIIDKQYFLIFLFVAVAFKCFFDIIFLVGDLDFLLYPVLFYVFFRNYFRRAETRTSHQPKPSAQNESEITC